MQYLLLCLKRNMQILLHIFSRGEHVAWNGDWTDGRDPIPDWISKSCSPVDPVQPSPLTSSPFGGHEGNATQRQLTYVRTLNLLTHARHTVSCFSSRLGLSMKMHEKPLYCYREGTYNIVEEEDRGWDRALEHVLSSCTGNSWLLWR